MAEVVIKGMEQFKRQIQRLDLSKRQGVLVKGLLRAVEPTRVEIGGAAPSDTGFLSRSIVAQENKRESDIYGVTVDIGATSKAFYGFFQEFGTAHHPPQEFMEPTIQRNLDEIQSKIVDFIEQEIEAALRV